MSVIKTLADKLKAAPSFTDMTGKNVLMKDSMGNLGAAAISSLVPIKAGGTSKFANALPTPGLYLCAVYSESNRFVNCTFTVLYATQSSTDNRSPFHVLDSQGGLTIQAVNAYGTIAPQMTSGDKPTDLRLLYIGVKV